MYKYSILPGNNAKALIEPLLKKRGNWVEQETNDLNCHFVWKPEQLTAKELFQLEKASGKTQPIHNHLENHKEITTKTGLIRSLRNFYSSSEQAAQNSYQTHDSIPTSFIITAQYEDFEYQSLLNRLNELIALHSNKERTPLKHCLKNIWLIKPAALNQGKGIELCRNLKDMARVLRNKPLNSMWLVQKYIERPLLINGRKFDIRVWAVATSQKELFFYNKGYIRTSSFRYDTEAKDNFIHLTNNCLQQHGELYGAYEEGNTLSFEWFQVYLTQNFPQYNLDFSRDFLIRIKDLIIDSYLSCRKIIHKNKKIKAFELFGYDFLIDEDFRVWLLEVNTNPYLGVPNEYISELLPAMLDDLLDITVDPHFQPSVKRERVINDFELLYCEPRSVFNKEGKVINKRQCYGAGIYPVPELAQQPLCKQCIAYRYEIDLTKLQPKFSLQSAKCIIDNPSAYSSSYISKFLTRTLKEILRNSPHSLQTSTEALKLILTSSLDFDPSETKHLPKLISILQLNPSHDLQRIIFSHLFQAYKTIPLRKCLFSQDIFLACIPILLSDPNSEIFSLCLDGILSLCQNPDRGIYVPGKSLDIRLIKDKFISQGGIILLTHLLLTNDSHLKISSFLDSEFSLEDFRRQSQVLKEKIFSELPQAILELNLKQVHKKIEGIIEKRVKEVTERQDLLRKEKDEQEKKLAELERKNREVEEEKQRKIEEYLKRKDREIKRNKAEVMKIELQEKEFEEKMLNEKRLAIMMKKKAEAQRAVLRKSVNDCNGLRKLEVARKEIDKKNRLKLIKEWKGFKKQLDRSILQHKIKEKLKNDVEKTISNYLNNGLVKRNKRSLSTSLKHLNKSLTTKPFHQPLPIKPIKTSGIKYSLPKSIDFYSKTACSSNSNFYPRP